MENDECHEEDMSTCQTCFKERELTCWNCEKDFCGNCDMGDDVFQCELDNCANIVCEKCVIVADSYKFCCRDCALKQYRIWKEQADAKMLEACKDFNKLMNLVGEEIDELNQTIKMLEALPECKGD